MKNFTTYLKQAHDNLSDVLGMPRADWDDIVHSTTDDELQEMVDVWEKENREKCYNEK